MQPIAIDMRGTFRLAILLACVSAINCGGSSPTTPDAQTGGSSGSTTPPTGGGGGGGGTAGNTSVYADGAFDDNAWDNEVQFFGAGGTGSAGHLHFNGQEGADYRRVSITVNSAGSTTAQVAVFSIKRDTAYFPVSDGRIITIDYSEDSIHLSGGGNGQYSAPAIRQNGKLYTLVPGGGAFLTPETNWTRHSLSGLTQNDFRTIASSADHPDFSATGARLEVGFMRLHSVPSGGSSETRVGGIDNWRITLFRP